MSLKMHPKHSKQLAIFTLKTLSAAVLATTLVSGASAAGLGRLTVLSALGQPLNAEIELTSVSKDEAGSLTAKLASSEAFRQANIEMNPALFALRFGIESRGGRQVIRVTSAQPVNEPFVDMLLELGGANGRLVREYTFLLDPVDMRSAQIAAPVAAPVRSSSLSITANTPPVAQNAVTATRESRPTPVTEAPPVRASRSKSVEAPAQPDSGEKTYTVKRGDSLARIANQVRSRNVSLDQMLVALYRANPTAFVGDNMNRMRSGQILTVPSADAARAVGNPEAHGVVVAQAQDFSAYRNKLAGQVSAAAPQKTAETGQTAAGKITTKVEETKSPVDDSKDRLRLSKSGVPAAGAVPAKAGVSISEDKIAKDKAISDANSRVKELEKNVSDLQKVLEVKNRDFADQQKKADLAAKAAAAAATAAVVTAAKPPMPVPPKASIELKKPAETLVASTPAVVAQPLAVTPPLVVTPPVVMSPAVTPPAVTPPAVTPPAVTPPAATLPAVTPPAGMPAQSSVDSSAPSAATPPPVVVAKPVKPVATLQKSKAAAATAETSWIDDLLGNAFLLPLLGVALVGLGAFGIFSSRRKKKSQQFEDSILTDSNLKANSLFGSTGGQSVDTNNSVFNSNFAPSASQLDANEVDPVAEADVYIAYGRDAQAEEILKEALRTQPERTAVRLKLLEIYAHRKDARSFELTASELYSMTKGNGDDWAHAASMGIALDPNNPLYAGGKPSSAEVATPAAPAATTTHSDDLDLEALLATTQMNTLAGSMNTLSPETVHPSARGLDLNTTSYLASSEVASPKAHVEPVIEHKLGDGLDFDLHGLDVQDVESKETLVHPSQLTSDHHNAQSMDFTHPTITEQHVPEAVAFVETARHEPVSLPVDTKVVEHADLHVPDHGMDFHLPDADLATPHVKPPEPPEPLKPAHVPMKAEPLAFDLSDINLDLNPDVSHPVEPVHVAPVPFASPVSPPHHFDVAHEATDTLVLEDDAISSTPEMATKLDLAIAYEEIGDKDGARELLDEVIKGGTAEQIVQAKGMLAKLG